MLAVFRAAASAGTGAGVAAGAVVNIVIDAATFARILDAAGRAPTSVDGLPVDPFTGLPSSNTLLEDLMADPAGHVRRVVLDSAGHVVDYGRTKRLFEGPARDAAKLLIRRCQHPGCDLPAGWSQVDHNTEWGDGGPTNQDNGGVLCAVHNITKHRLGLHRRRGINGIDYTIRPNGTIIFPVGARTPRFERLDDPDDRPDDPDQIREPQHHARERLRALRPSAA